MAAKQPVKPRQALRVEVGRAVASRIDDPWLSNLWLALPNPDTVLRKMGARHAVFDQLLGDAHIIGELRSVRAGLLGFEWRIMPGGAGRAARRATDLARQVMAAPPGPDSTWMDVIWSMALAVFRGYSVHDVQWGRFGADILPARLIDRPQRRFVFSSDDNALRVLTRRDAVNGEAVEERQALVTRHMPTFDNPYGVATFSACLWPYTFKRAGFKFFTQFTEKFGVPAVVAKHPPGWNDEQVEQLVKALKQLANNAVGAVEEGVDMLPLAGGGGATGSNAATPQERLIRACNAEISKALTSQTLATEIQGQGSRAAADTHLQREQSVHVSDRAMISSTLNKLFRWITDINLGPQVPSPTHFFYEQDAAPNDWADAIETVRHFLPLKAEQVYERLGLTPPAPGDEVIAVAAPGPAPNDGGQPKPPGARHMSSRCPGCGQYHFQAGAGAAGDDPLLDALEAALAGDLYAGAADGLAGALLRAAAEDPDAVQSKLAERYPDLDAAEFESLLARVLFVADLLGGASDHG